MSAMDASHDGSVWAIVGPTAAGKTRISFELAKEIGAEIISVDSRQVYRYLDVGTDKISRAERLEVVHHLIDVADPDEIFTASDFVSRASDAVRRIRARGRIPILVGGSAMYFRALEGRLLSDSLPRDDEVRRALEDEASLRGSHALHAELSEIDPSTADRIHPNDKLRIIRALELHRLTGSPPSELFASLAKIGGMRMNYIGIRAPREMLYDKIARRAAAQFANGYREEVQWLLDHGYHRGLPAMQGFGYRELVRHIDGEMTIDEALEGDIRSTKTFSRRQMTWFRHFSPILWYDASAPSSSQIAGELVRMIGDPERYRAEVERWSS